MGKISLSIFSVFVAMMLAFSVSATYHTDEGAAENDGLNDPDTFGDPEDDGLDLGDDTDTQRAARDDTGTQDRMTDTRSARDTTGTAGQSNNTRENDTVGTRNTTVTRSSSQGTAVRGDTDTREARTMCTSADSQRAATAVVSDMGTYRVIDSETFDTQERTTVYVFADTSLDRNVGPGASDDNLDRIGVGAEADTEENVAGSEAGSGVVYVVVGECEVKGVIADDSLMFAAGDDQRAARDADANGFVTIERNIVVSSTDDQRNARDTMPSDEREMPWETLDEDARDARDDDEDDESMDDSNDLNRPSYVR